MKAVKSLSKVIISLILALALTTLTACDVLDDFFGKGGEDGGFGGITGGNTTYSVTLNPDGGTLSSELTQYTEGTSTTLPTATKDYYDFDGWYEDSYFSGDAVTAIPSTATGDKTYYAKWTPKTYTIIYYVNNKISTNETVKSYVYGEGAILPVPSDPNYTFNGWYENSGLSGNKVTQISATDNGNKTFYASSVGVQFTVTLNANGGTISSGNITSYTFGVGATLPIPTMSGMKFAGWYTNSNFTGSKVTAISATDSGNKVFYAKWTEQSAIEATFGGYEEGAYVEFELDSSVSLSDVTVSYKSNTNSTVTLSGADKENLVRRIDDSTARADIVGIAAGTCQITVDVDGDTVSDSVTVTAYDRSGYAHFNYTSGVGAYNDDGTPKSGAVIVYVNEATKNTVQAKIGSKTYTGLKNILAAATTGTPLIVRIVGRIAAPTWAHEDGNPLIQYTRAGTKITAAEVIAQTQAKFGITLTSGVTYKQADLISSYQSYGIKLENGIAELDGLTSTMSVASDTCWNDMQIGGSSSRPQNVTVEGIGTDAEIFQWGLTWKYASSIEIRNLTFTDYTEDACSFQGNSSKTDSQHLWVHNCTFNKGKSYWDLSDDQDKGDGDGATDFKWAQYITISYNNYYNNHKTGLIGANSGHQTYNVTFQHNFYEICQSRLPLAREGNLHMYNNYYYGSFGTNMSLRSNAYAYIEYCYFENCLNTIEYNDDTVMAKVYQCTFVGCRATSSSYTYILENNVTSRTQVVSNASNNNGVSNTFDTNSTLFYYANGKTNVSNLITSTDEVRYDCVNNAGVHKPSSWVQITTQSALNDYHASRAK